MGRFAVVCCVLATAVAACFFEPGKPLDHQTSDGGVDASPDALPCQGTTTCNGDTLHVACTGGSAIDIPCGWGCSGSGSAHCLVLDPTGGTVTSVDTTNLPSAALTVASGTVIDTDALTISPSGSADARLVGTVAVFRVGSLTMNGTVRVVGSHALAIVAAGAIMIDGTLDLTGGCGSNIAGPGGAPGGLATAAAAGTTGGGEASGNGGGGGGNGGGGGSGGHKNTTTQAPGGAAAGDPTIPALVGGGGGGGGGDTQSGVGGGGGGAVQLISNTRIDVAIGAAINAGGCGGWGPPGTAATAAGGGGAGGTIVLEAPAISLAGTLAVNGGGGGGGDQNGTRGGNGSASALPAAGGSSPTTGDVGAGGSGAAGVIGQGGVGGNAVHSGGGGGGAGWMRFNTRPAGLTTTGAVLSPPFGSTGTTTSGTATVH